MAKGEKAKKLWRDLAIAEARGLPVRVVVLKREGTQLLVQAGVKGRIQMRGTRKTRDELDRMVGQTMIVRATKVDAARGILELGLRHPAAARVPTAGPVGPVMPRPLPQRRDPKPGDVVQTVIIGVKPEGVVVRLEAGDGVVSKGELSWDAVDDPADFTSPGDRHHARVLSQDARTGWYRLSIKQATNDPYDDLHRSWSPNHRYLALVRAVDSKDVELELQLRPTVRAIAPMPELLADGSDAAASTETRIAGQLVWARLHGVDREKRRITAALDGIREGDPVPAVPSWGVPLELAEALEWERAGFAPSEAAPWVVAGHSSSEAHAWVQAGIDDPEIATSWTEAGVGPEEISAWTRIGFPPHHASNWLRHGLGPKDAAAWSKGFRYKAERKKWRDDGRDPEVALRWAAAGWADLDNAIPYRKEGYTDPAVALAAYRAGTLARSDHGIVEAAQTLTQPEIAPTSLRTPSPPVRLGRVRDELFGSPRTPAALQAWTARVTGEREAWAPAPRDLRNVGLPWPPRLSAHDVVALRAELDLRVSTPTWPRSIAPLNRAALHVLADPGESSAVLESQAPPADWLPDVVLPFPVVAVWFAARFHLQEEQRRRLPGWDPSSPQSQLPYEPWLAELAEGHGALAGVILRSGSSVTGLADECIWLVEVDGHVIPIPARLSESALAPIARSLAAALCFGSWTRSVPGRRPSYRSGSEMPSRPRPQSQVHVVTYRGRSAGAEVTGAGGYRRGHARRGHWRRSRIGPVDNWHYEWRWIGPTYVGGTFVDRPETVYVLPRLVFRSRRG